MEYLVYGGIEGKEDTLITSFRDEAKAELYCSRNYVPGVLASILVKRNQYPSLIYVAKDTSDAVWNSRNTD